MDRILDQSALFAVVLTLASAASGCAGATSSAPKAPSPAPTVERLTWLPADATQLSRYPGQQAPNILFVAEGLGDDAPPCFAGLTARVETYFDVVRPSSEEPVRVYVGDLPRAEIERCALAVFGATATRDGATTRFRSPGGKSMVAGWTEDRRVVLHPERGPVEALLAPTPPPGPGPLVALHPRLRGDGMVILLALDVASAALGVPSAGIELTGRARGAETRFIARVILRSAADAEQARRAAETLAARPGVSPALAGLLGEMTFAVERSDLVVDITPIFGAFEQWDELNALLTGTEAPAP